MARKKAVVAEVSIFPKEFPNGVVVNSAKAVDMTVDGVNVLVTLKHTGDEELSFHAVPYDTEPHGVWLYEEGIKGTFGKPSEYERPLPTVQDLQEELDKLMPDVMLGLATEDELSLAKSLRIQIKAMTNG